MKFFALFTTVKGISASVKRRAYLDKLLVLVKKGHDKTWSNLYLRAFLRSSDYLALTLRLVLLGVLVLLFIPNHLVAAGLALIFNYLLLFQLLGLAQHFEYQYLTRLYPISEIQKMANLKVLLKTLSIFICLMCLFYYAFIMLFEGCRASDFNYCNCYRMVSSLQNCEDD